jgi:hypothetical protein
MHLYLIAFCWFIISVGLRQIIQVASDNGLFEESNTENTFTIVLASILTLLYFPTLGMCFYYLYWAVVWSLGG